MFPFGVHPRSPKPFLALEAGWGSLEFQNSLQSRIIFSWVHLTHDCTSQKPQVTLLPSLSHHTFCRVDLWDWMIVGMDGTWKGHPDSLLLTWRIHLGGVFCDSLGLLESGFQPFLLVNPCKYPIDIEVSRSTPTLIVDGGYCLQYRFRVCIFMHLFNKYIGISRYTSQYI